MLAQKFAALVLCLLALFGNAGVVYAGFGITPPYITSDTLTRGSVFRQTINLVRSDADADLKASVTLNVPGAQDWFTLEPGGEFIVPKGKNQVPITFTIKVPSNAPYKEYKGTVRIRTAPVNTAKGGTGVSIALGAQIDVDLKVVDKIYNFEVRRVRTGDLEEGRILWGLYFPGKIRFYMTVKNTGNTDFAPTRVHFDIYDNHQETLLESIDSTNKVELVAPFSTKEVVAELPTRLPAGAYVAKYTIYKNDQVAQQNTVNLAISAAGTVIGYSGYGFEGLSRSDQLKVVGVLGVPVLLLLTLLGVLWRKWRLRRRRRRAGSLG